MSVDTEMAGKIRKIFHFFSAVVTKGGGLGLNSPLTPPKLPCEPSEAVQKACISHRQQARE